MLIFLFQALTQIFGRDVAGFAIRQIALGTYTEFDKTGMRQPQHHAFPVHEKLAIQRVCMPRGDSVPTMREAATVYVVRDLRWHIESADELAHRAGVWNRRKCCLCHFALARLLSGAHSRRLR